MSTTIDLNCDLGEGGPADAELLTLVTSANIACGFHAGDASTMMRTLRLALDHGVSIGAHPGYADREHFGRRELVRTPEALLEELAYQIGALQGLARVVGAEVRYLKPHGALYNQACRDPLYAMAVCQVTETFGTHLVGLPRSLMATLCDHRGTVPFIPEGFADRRYREDGTLVPRTDPNAFIHDASEAVDQALRLIQHTGIRTLCVHGDNPLAVAFVRTLRQELQRHQIIIRSFV